MSPVVRTLAFCFGALWFLPVSCTTGMIVAYPLVSKSYERHMERGDAPHALFYVVWQPGAGSDPFGFSTLANLAPAKTPAPIINRLNQEIVRYVTSAEGKDTFFTRGAETVGNTPAQFGAAMGAEIARLDKLIKAIGLRAD